MSTPKPLLPMPIKVLLELTCRRGTLNVPAISITRGLASLA